MTTIFLSFIYRSSLFPLQKQAKYTLLQRYPRLALLFGQQRFLPRRKQRGITNVGAVLRHAPTLQLMQLVFALQNYFFRLIFWIACRWNASWTKSRQPEHSVGVAIKRVRVASRRPIAFRKEPKIGKR